MILNTGGRAARWRQRHGRPGATLIEMVAALALLALVAGVVTPALRDARHAPREERATLLAAARDTALREGRPVTIVVRLDGRVVAATAFPDGSVVADSALGLNPLTGSTVDGREGRRVDHEP